MLDKIINKEELLRSLEKMTLMSDYMFGAVMEDTENLKPLLEAVLGIKIRRLRWVEKQKTEKPSYQSRGIRKDLYVEDEYGQVFNVEVQTTNRWNLPKRIRYYQSVTDSEILKPGEDYKNLQRSYTIFLCNYDPFDRKRYLYTFENICREEKDLSLGDETLKVVVNTKGKRGRISKKLKEIVHYLDTGEAQGDYTKKLDAAVRHVKNSEERRHEYMIAMIKEMEIREEGREEGRKEGREEGREEGRKEGRTDLLFSLVSEGMLSMADAARKAGMTEGEFREMYRNANE